MQTDVRSGLCSIQNRKYLGSKTRLLDFIDQVIMHCAGDGLGTFIDAFAGTGVVAHRFLGRTKSVVACDNLLSNYVGLKTFLAADADAAADTDSDSRRLEAFLEELNALPPFHGYAAEHYSGTYFTLENTERIDAIRERIAEWQSSGVLTPTEEAVLLTSLVYACDKSANTIGQYDAFLKHIAPTPGAAEASGRHIVDSNVHKPIRLRLPDFSPHPENRAILADVLRLPLECDILYLDPPYNTRQYADCYHVLENIVRWEKPPVHGKTRKFDRSLLKSPFSRKSEATGALAGLIGRAKCRHIFLSYNSEGIVEDADILAMFGARGAVETFEQAYPIFGNGAGRSVQRPIKERIFWCRVEK